MTDIAPLLGVLAALVGIANTLPYIRDTLRGATRPHRGTWLIWSALTIVVLLSQRADGATWSLLMTGVQVVLTTLTFLPAIRRGEGGVRAGERVMIAIAGGGVIAWIAADEPIVATACVVAADLIGAAMMAPKAYRDPHSETVSTFALASVSGALATGAVGSVDPALLLYPVYFALVNGAIALLIHHRRARLRAPITASSVGSLAPRNRSTATEMSPAIHRFACACVLPLLAGLLLALSGCGGDGDGGDDGQTGGRHGGSITIAHSFQPDSLDPAIAYGVTTWEALWLVYTPPLTYKRAEGKEGAELIPGVAKELPTVSDDGKTYKLALREGLKFSDGTPAKASDFEHTIKRVLSLESGGSSFFLGIDGATEYVEAGRPEADIPGIETDDETGEIAIELTEPDGTFSNVLAMEFAGLVPGDTPFENLTKDPPPGIGPYKITESVPNRQFVLEKNRRFDIPGIPKGRLDKITTVIVTSRARQAQDVITGELDYMQASPPPDLKPEVTAKYSDRYEEQATNATFYLFMDTRTPPFDKKEVREAVNYGIDKPGLARLFAGELAPGCSFLPPGMPGYDRALNLGDCPWGDPNQPPDLEKARQLIADAGAEGADVTVWGSTYEPDPQLTQAYADMLNKMGLDAKPKIIDAAIYGQTVGNAKTEAQTGVTNWFQDFPHPKNFMFRVDGNSIQPTNNQNLGNVDDPEITAGIAELSQEPELTGEVADRWGELNRQLVEEGWIAPYGHIEVSTFVSERMDFDNCTLFHPVYNNDYSSFCLR